jgi:hypothetical protein
MTLRTGEEQVSALQEEIRRVGRFTHRLRFGLRGAAALIFVALVYLVACADT